MKISVAMSTYNGARYLREQLESIALQSQPPYEVIVCDDGSHDESVKIIENFAAGALFPVHLHLNTTNLGSIKSFERAISLCAGEVIALCDQDDIWLPEKLARFDAEFARAPEVGLVFTDAEIVDGDLRPMGYSLWEKLGFGSGEREHLSRGEGFDSLLLGATVTGATAALRAQFKPLVLPIPDDLPVIHDAWIAILIAAVSRVVPIPERLVRYRQHKDQQIGALARQGSRHAPGSDSLQEGLRRENPYAEMLAIARAVQRRLVERKDEFESHKVRRTLEARITHLVARSDLRRGKLQRSQKMLRELLGGRYHRYSNGFRSFVKDLLA